MMFIDFSDAAHDATAWPANSLTGRAAALETYLEAQSYGRLGVDVTLAPNWVTLTDSVTNYLVTQGEDGRYLHITRAATAALKTIQSAGTVDVTNGGDGYDALVVTTPLSRFDDSVLWAYENDLTVDLDDNPITANSTIAPVVGHNGLWYSDATQTVTDAEAIARQVEAWQAATSLQLLRAMGGRLERDFNLDYAPAGAGDEVTEISFGALGLNVAWITSDAPDTAVLGDDAANDPTVEQRSAPEMLAWTRWAMGWLEDDEVACLGRGHSRVTLDPVHDAADGSGAVIVPLGRLGYLVLEARRQQGYDAAHTLVAESSVGGVVEPAVVEERLPSEGVLAYIARGFYAAIDPQTDRLTRYYARAVPVAHIGRSIPELDTNNPLMTPTENSLFLLSSNNSPLVAVAITDDDGESFTVDVSMRVDVT